MLFISSPFHGSFRPSTASSDAPFNIHQDSYAQQNTNNYHASIWSVNMYWCLTSLMHNMCTHITMIYYMQSIHLLYLPPNLTPWSTHKYWALDESSPDQSTLERNTRKWQVPSVKTLYTVIAIIQWLCNRWNMLVVWNGALETPSPYWPLNGVHLSTIRLSYCVFKSLMSLGELILGELIPC